MGIRKSFAPLVVAIIGIIVSITFFVLPFIFFLTFKYHVVANVKLSYEYNSADIVLLELLQTKYKNYSNYGLISENFLPSFETFRVSKRELSEELNNSLKLLTLSDCYNLTTTDNDVSVLIQSGSCKPRNITWSEIFVPYNPNKLVRKVTLEVG